MARRVGGHLYFRLDIIRINGLSKHILSTYFPGMKIDPKHTFLHAFFLIFAIFFLKKIYNNHQKHTSFSKFSGFASLHDACSYIAWSWKTTLITWFVLWGWHPLWNTSAPPPKKKWVWKQEKTWDCWWRQHLYIRQALNWGP